MIKVSVLYPHEKGKKFDIDYYCNKHVPMVQELMGSTLKAGAVEHGISGAEPGSAPIYAAMGHLYFDSVEAFQAAFGPHAKTIFGDIPNYSEVQPVVQISEVKL